MPKPKYALGLVSQAYYEAMADLVRSANWLDDIYERGKHSRSIEVPLTKRVIGKLGGVAEVRPSTVLPDYAFPEELKNAFASYAWLRGQDARIDGYFPSLHCFWEAKVSKLDQFSKKAGAKSLHDIGQWAQDLAKLTEVGQHIPKSELIYSVAAIAQEPVTHSSDPQVWLHLFRQKLEKQLYNDLIRVKPELLEDDDHRRRQLLLLLRLMGLGSGHFHIIPADKWAIISFQVRPLI